MGGQLAQNMEQPTAVRVPINMTPIHAENITKIAMFTAIRIL